MAEVVIDTNVVVGYLDRYDSLHERASAVFDGLEQSSERAELLSFLVAEAVSVLARRCLASDIRLLGLGQRERDVDQSLCLAPVVWETMEPAIPPLSDAVPPLSGAVPPLGDVVLPPQAHATPPRARAHSNRRLNDPRAAMPVSKPLRWARGNSVGGKVLQSTRRF